MTNNFDERQLLIKSSIFKRMFWIMASLILLNGLSAKFFDIVWADMFYSSVIIFFITLAIGSIEMMFREVYFTNPGQRWVIIIFGILGLTLFILNIIHLSRGDELILNGTLTETGGSLIYSLPMLSMGIGGAVKTIRDRINKNDEE